jgi:uncharacterized membrane protein YozB (DUF420 family)
MTHAPIISTIIAIGLIPVAFLFSHAFLSGIKKWKYHKFTGMSAIIWDLSMSIGYMLYRTLGGKVEGHRLDLNHALLLYFIAHGIIALTVILLEIAVLITGLAQWKQKKTIGWHRSLGRILFVLWWLAFLSGELFYLVAYVF